jgi:23S rRNA (cytidine1920-2'-O)/16S rRNA (cytidine1409-2'-O)-methyltransferase
VKRVPRRRGASQGAPARPAAGPKTAARPKTKERLDVALVTRGLAPTREKAARLIMAGHVEVNGQRADKAGVLIDEAAPVAVAQRQKFVSRGGDKLAPVLDAFNVSPRGRICVDVGASTGGFTHCLLERGASRVYAVDAGHGQLDAGLRADGRVVVMEKTNGRHLVAAAFADPPELATVDVSFISLEKVLPAVYRVLAPAGEAITLVKPQFEVGKGQVGKGGVVRDPANHHAVISRVARYAVLHGWHVRGVAASPLKGPKGNREFFLYLCKTGRTIPDLDALIARAAAPEPE